MKRFWQRKRYAMVTWEAYQDGQVVFRGNTTVDYRPGDRQALHDELKDGAATYASSAIGRLLEPKHINITGFFPVP